jgi:hypothetical protein
VVTALPANRTLRLPHELTNLTGGGAGCTPHVYRVGGSTQSVLAIPGVPMPRAPRHAHARGPGRPACTEAALALDDSATLEGASRAAASPQRRPPFPGMRLHGATIPPWAQWGFTCGVRWASLLSSQHCAQPSDHSGVIRANKQPPGTLIYGSQKVTTGLCTVTPQRIVDVSYCESQLGRLRTQSTDQFCTGIQGQVQQWHHSEINN